MMIRLIMPTVRIKAAAILASSWDLDWLSNGQKTLLFVFATK